MLSQKCRRDFKYSYFAANKLFSLLSLSLSLSLSVSLSAVLGFELRAYTLSHSTSSLLIGYF
jgi:hypothetical protein